MNMLESFKRYVADNQLFEKSDSLIVAVSGGIDSVALVHLLHQSGFCFSIAHCNFGLRGDESERDERFVRQLAEQYGVAFYSKYLNVTNYAAREGMSIQHAARHLRYEWFNLLLKQYSYQYSVTAHHQNDVVETVIYNMVKGTGIAGLHGIRPKNKQLVRPMLFATREDIVNYVKEHQLEWREDSSNQLNKYSRNLIRNEVVPLLKQINPSLEMTMQQTIARISAVEHVFEEVMERLREKLIRRDAVADYIDIEGLAQESEVVIKLFYLVKEYHFNYVQAQDIADSLHKNAGISFESPTHLLVKDRSQLVITVRAQEKDMQVIELTDNISIFSNHLLQLHLSRVERDRDFSIPVESSVACLDYNKLDFPLVLRKWRDGDRFYPLGMSQQKKLSDFLNEQKVPLNLKDKVWVLCSGEAIAWIVGYRLDNRFKITEKTQKIFRIEMKNE